MAENTQLFDNIPVGLIDKLKQQVNLAGEIKSICYRDHRQGNGTYKFELDPKVESIDVIIVYNIDEDMQWSFESYLETWMQKQIENYNVAELCWSIPNEQRN